MEITIFEQQFRSLYVQTFQEVVTPFYQRISLIRPGNPLQAISMKPSNIWYANTYALALQQLGDTPILRNGELTPAAEIYNSFKREGVFFGPLGSSTYWEYVENEQSLTGKSRRLLRMKQNVSPAKAYESFSKQLSFLDCNAIMDVAMALTLIKQFGGNRFDRVYLAHKEGTHLLGDSSNRIRALAYKASQIAEQTLPLGHSYFVRNTPDYPKKHTFGNADSFNLVYVGDNAQKEALFTGFGLNPQGETLANIKKQLLLEYNQPPLQAQDLLGPELTSAYEKQQLTTYSEQGVSKTLSLYDLKEQAKKSTLHRQLLDQVIELQQKRAQATLTEEEFFSQKGLCDDTTTLADIDTKQIIQLFNKE